MGAIVPESSRVDHVGADGAAKLAAMGQAHPFRQARNPASEQVDGERTAGSFQSCHGSLCPFRIAAERFFAQNQARRMAGSPGQHCRMSLVGRADADDIEVPREEIFRSHNFSGQVPGFLYRSSPDRVAVADVRQIQPRIRQAGLDMGLNGGAVRAVVAAGNAAQPDDPDTQLLHAHPLLRRHAVVIAASRRQKSTRERAEKNGSVGEIDS